MYTIRVGFQRFRDVDLSELIGAVGVYVIWDATAKARPTYIGEGNVLKRFTDHVERDGRKIRHPWDGYVALIRGSTRNVHKEESKAVERLLLDVAEDAGRNPRANAHPGSSSAVMGFCRDETLRVEVRGCDPLVSPKSPVQSKKEIKARATGEDSYDLEHDWRHRRTRAPIIKSVGG